MSFKLSKNYKKKWQVISFILMRKGDLYSCNINLELISE